MAHPMRTACFRPTTDNIEEYIDFVDSHVFGELPSADEDLELHDLAQFYQCHTHSKTCQKYKNIQCHFDFGKLFTSRTIVSVSLVDDISDPVRSGILENRCDILNKVKAKINESLDPSKQDYDQTSDISIEVILQELGITLEEYYNALQISGDKDLHLHLKRSSKSCFINNYFVAGIKGWKANVDLQPVYSCHKCISYICS